MNALIPEFNDARIKVGGDPVHVDGLAASSGDVETKIARGQLQPAAWSPASSLWGLLLNQEADKEYVAAKNPSLATSPVVIAMWEPLARALGWPAKAIGFADIPPLPPPHSPSAKPPHPPLVTLTL